MTSPYSPLEMWWHRRTAEDRWRVWGTPAPTHHVLYAWINLHRLKGNVEWVMNRRRQKRST